MSRPWDKSLCNPYNMSPGAKCGLPNPSLAIPEKPHIISVVNPLGLNPFVKVEVLRTPVDGFHFTIDEYYGNKKYEFIATHTFTTYKYQNYVPSEVFTDYRFYTVRCQGFNAAGVSVFSNEYAVDLTHPSRYQEFICGDGIICGVPLLCT